MEHGSWLRIFPIKKGSISITFQRSVLANKLSIKPLLINLRILDIYFSFFMLFPDTIWYGKQSMVKCKRNKIDI